MNNRTLEEYKNQVFNKLTNIKKLNYMYQMSKKLCDIESNIIDFLCTEEYCRVDGIVIAEFFDKLLKILGSNNG